MRSSVRHGIHAATIAVSVLLLLVVGAALRPLLVDDPAPSGISLSGTEIGFAQDMNQHHQQALFLVQRLDSGVDPVVRRLAAQIDSAQRIEIGTMLGWLQLAGAAPTSTEPMAWMTSDAGSHTGHHSTAAADRAALMPGMASWDELGTLAEARGRAAEVLFLQLMIRHHQGGIAMAQAVDALLVSGPVKETARSMAQEQRQEIGVMSMMLDSFGAVPLPVG
ncbi:MULTISPECIES: DUF305 domain-containing protein [unclassified Nocardia]|uniref:DUF305 domain-containing protein n=1 Tax=unclassified Nocardia TaxID=2637762 RepID=UPI0033AADC25